MLRLLTTDEFADWFGALNDRTAEEVAFGLDLVEQLGPTRAAPASTEWLLWYEAPRAAANRLRDENVDQYTWARGSVRSLVDRLDSPRFITRVGELAPQEAAMVSAAVAQLRAIASCFRYGLAQSPWGEIKLDACYYERARWWYLRALSAAGFQLSDIPEHSSALRELVLRSEQPGVRVIYGVDIRRDAALCVLGERLERCTYGDSVRRAQRVWDQFLQDNVGALQFAGLR